jgi:hypothetical protein
VGVGYYWFKVIVATSLLVICASGMYVCRCWVPEFIGWMVCIRVSMYNTMGDRGFVFIYSFQHMVAEMQSGVDN